MYFPDLTPYVYGRAEPRPDILNVGWLSADQPLATGTPDGRLVPALERLVASPVNLYRGIHVCEFCPPPPVKTSPINPLARIVEPPPGTAGNGEIRVRASNGTTYVAPVLVLHYVSKHQYLPPQEFIEAAIKAALP